MSNYRIIDESADMRPEDWAYLRDRQQSRLVEMFVLPTRVLSRGPRLRPERSIKITGKKKEESSGKPPSKPPRSL